MDDDVLVTIDAGWLDDDRLETTYVVTTGNGWLETDSETGKLDIVCCG